MNTIKIKRLSEEAILPQRATPGSAGLDLCACLNEPMTIYPGERVVVPTGLAIALPDNTCAALVYARSGLATRHGLALSNGVGVVDSDYRGELKVGLCNHGGDPYTIEPGERIAQMIITPVLCPELEESDELDDTERGEGGFGSTGKVVRY